MNAAAKIEKRISLPRKGMVVTIDGVRHDVLRRYCHGMFFDLAAPNGALVCMSESNMVDGLRSGQITVMSAKGASTTAPKQITLDTYSDFAVIRAGDITRKFTGEGFASRAREFAISLR